MLFEKLFSSLLYGIVINFHLLGEVLLQPFILLNLVTDEHDGKLTVYLNTGFAFLAVVEPRLSPPSDTGLVGEYAYCPWNVEALNFNIQVCQRVNLTTVGYSLLECFFFNSSGHVETNTPKFRAR